jgi:hypothetical protein
MQTKNMLLSPFVCEHDTSRTILLIGKFAGQMDIADGPMD